jgi:YD repeat-containing protein
MLDGSKVSLFVHLTKSVARQGRRRKTRRKGQGRSTGKEDREGAQGRRTGKEHREGGQGRSIGKEDSEGA